MNSVKTVIPCNVSFSLAFQVEWQIRLVFSPDNVRMLLH